MFHFVLLFILALVALLNDLYNKLQLVKIWNLIPRHYLGHTCIRLEYQRHDNLCDIFGNFCTCALGFSHDSLRVYRWLTRILLHIGTRCHRVQHRYLPFVVATFVILGTIQGMSPIVSTAAHDAPLVYGGIGDCGLSFTMTTNLTDAHQCTHVCNMTTSTLHRYLWHDSLINYNNTGAPVNHTLGSYRVS